MWGNLDRTLIALGTNVYPKNEPEIGAMYGEIEHETDFMIQIRR